MRIVLDAMGSDTCPGPEVLAAAEAVSSFEEDLILVGPAQQLNSRLQSIGANLNKIKIVDAPDTITMEDKGLALVLKAKKPSSRTSMAIGIDLVKNGTADAFVTAGNTGGAMTTAYFRLGTIQGLERPALAATFPVKKGYCIVLDIGANPDCKPEHLLQFAIMGSVFANKARGIDNPRVAILSNGEESGKGNELVRATYPLLTASGLNFIGNVEGKELFQGAADVVVTDGFTGNVLLKSSEAVAKLFKETLKEQLYANPITKFGALLSLPAFRRMEQMMDPDAVGAAPLLGVNGLVFIGHGRSGAQALFSAIQAARQAVAAEVLSATQEAVKASIASLNGKGA